MCIPCKERLWLNIMMDIFKLRFFKDIRLFLMGEHFLRRASIKAKIITKAGQASPPN